MMVGSKMDISSLLSPQDTPVHTSNPDAQQSPSSKSPYRSPLSGRKEPSLVQQATTANSQRHTATSMDTLADLATMQHYQHTVRQRSNSLRNPDMQSPHHSPTHPAYKDLVQIGDRSGQATAKRVRNGSVAQAYPATDQPPEISPTESDLPIMDLSTPLSEQLWLNLLHTNIKDARNTQDRAEIIESLAKAVQEEVGSTKLWRLYGDWMWLLHKKSFGITGAYDDCPLEQEGVDSIPLSEQTWSAEDIAMGKEVFQWDGMMDVWRQGVASTQWHIDDSNTVWDPYMELTMYDLSLRRKASVQNVRNLFNQRLRQPHKTWEDTFQIFSQFISKYDETSYEKVMVDTKVHGNKAKQEYDLRQDREIQLRRAVESQDSEAEKVVWQDYLDWEDTLQRKKKPAPNARNIFLGLCERANLRFPAHAPFWMDHITFLLERIQDSGNLLAVAERATRHCPGSGEVWQERLYALEICGKDWKELEEAKHNATSTGLLAQDGRMEESIKVDFAWCSYLRRKAFHANATEDDRDLAEVAIRHAMENVQSQGESMHGKKFRGDPEFLIERIYLKFLAQAGRHDDARKMFRDLEATHGDYHFFWERWYLWEMTVWDGTIDHSSRTGSSLAPPRHATIALQRALKRPTLDWPEKIIEMYTHHCAQHENVQRLLEAHVECRRASKLVAKRRAKEAEEAAAQHYAAYQAQAQRPQEAADTTDSNGKRKREDQPNGETPSKRPRQGQENGDTNHAGDASSQASTQIKRDRENTTVIVRHLPGSTTEAEVRRFFRDCGKILSLNLLPDSDKQTPSGTSTATVEFESKEDVLTAQTKGMKSFNGQSIEIQVGTGTTLWVTNYPPEADEEYIRNLFGQCGDVMEVRFPSLKYGTHRRFCYVQFTTSAQAQAATQLDGKALGGKFILEAKLSNPGAKQNRKGAMEEGREIHVGNVDWSARESDLEELFGKSGRVESVRIPRNMNGKSKGAAFVVFAAKEEAQAAVTEMNLKDFNGRVLNVTISRPNTKRTATTVVNNSASPEAESASSRRPSAADDASMPDADAQDRKVHHSQRTLALLNLADTVNDARIRALVEPHGALRKIVLRPDRGGALVEFENIADVGRAGMAIDGVDLAGSRIRIGTPADLLHSSAVGDSSASVPVRGKPAIKAARPVARPGHGGGLGRRGGRGGLGFTGHRNNTHATVKPSSGADVNGQDAAGASGNVSKSQNDFRTLLGNGKATGGDAK